MSKQNVRLWLDDLRPAPEGWFAVHSVNEAIAVMETHEVTYASLDHDLGQYVDDGGDGIKLLDWMAENNHWPTSGIAVHSANPVGVERMLATIRRYAPYEGTPAGIPTTSYINVPLPITLDENLTKDSHL